MGSTSSQEELVKTSIPRRLQMAIIRLQADGDLNWDEACEKASELVDSNGTEFKKAVEHEAQRLHKSKFLEQMNRARLSIHNNGFEEGVKWVRENEDNFRAPCSVCGKPMYFSQNNSNWEEVKKTLHPAFANWHHTTCQQAT